MNIAMIGSRYGGLEGVVSGLIKMLKAQGHCFITGCASGIDTMVVKHAPPDRLTVMMAFADPAQTGNTQGIRAARAAGADVRTVAFSGSKGARIAYRSQQIADHSDAMIGFAWGPCPEGLLPNARWQIGNQAGTWQTLAYAIGNGKPVAILSAQTGDVYQVIPGWRYEQFPLPLPLTQV